jgi:uncharacterized protein YdhG (YjbR/CyaY superfamily)
VKKPPTTLPTAIDEYLAATPEPARTTLSKLRATIRAAAPRETTESISYAIPTFKYKGALVAFAAFKNHCTLFACSGTALSAFTAELKGYETTKSGIHMPLDKPLPATLVKKLVKARVAQNELSRHA